jgi:hypothetical protein
VLKKKRHPAVENADGRENKYASATMKRNRKKEKSALIVPVSSA